MKHQKVYRGRRTNMALPLLIMLLAVAVAAIVLVSCNAQQAPAEEVSSQPEASQSQSTEPAGQEPAEEPSAGQSEEPEQELPAQESESSPEAGPAVSDGKEITVPQTAEWKEFSHLFPAGTDDFRLVLVNKEYTMPDEFPDLPLKTVTGDYKVHAEMYDSLMAMMDAARAEGLPLVIISGYRPIARSKALYENKVQEYVNAGYSKEEAAVEAGKWIAPPGTSEHATGLAADLISADYYTKLNDLVQEFENFDEAKWLKAHCAEYGFILRFPKGKEDITQVVYEPWHFRYVGVEAAQEIMSRGITLEEYLGVA